MQKSPTDKAGRSGLRTPNSGLRTLSFRRWRLWVLAACLGVPLLAFGVAGTLWLYERRWLGWAGLVFLCGEALLLVLFRRWSRTEGALLPQPPTTLPAEFAPRDEAAWELVREYLDRIDRGEISLASLDQFWSLGQEILGRVAAFYRPDDKEPLLAIQVPLLFRAIEETARDLATVTAGLPFAHRITIGDAVRGYRMSQKLKPAYNVYRLLYPLLNWKNALFQLLVTDRLLDVTKETLSQWLLKWYVDRVGYHAIELYSGKLLLTRRFDAGAHFTLASAPTEDRGETQASAPVPLRILILGQVKAGKSSLVNALFADVRAATDVVPTTAQLTSYVLERPDLGGTIILSDMGGYEDSSVPQERVEEALTEALHSDLILLVVSAINAAREPDRRLLAQLHDQFAAQPQLRPPPVVVVLTHIDLLRPRRDWAPPYNIVIPDSPKARSIRGALDAVAADLRLTPELVLPVCLLPERLYNVEEALVPLLVQVLPEAKRTLLLRSLKILRQREQWELLGRQARAAGRFLLEIGGEVLKKPLERVLAKRECDDP
ncbi:MAG: GTPase domain-containing protein [Deltaproteobacteria bacterium]|nr:GTPase domain-containing protein [Deltaproteobacteria bacterium]